MTKWIGGVLVLAGAVWIWKQIGFIRMEQPLSERKRRSSIFAPTAPRYARTQRPNYWRLRTTARMEARKRA